MRTPTRGVKKAAAAMALGALAVVASACSSSSSSSTTTTAAPTTTTTTPPIPSTVIPTQPANSTIAATVPASIHSAGSLTVALDASYPPNEFVASDGTTIVGMDADLSNAIAQTMGLKAKLVNATFSTIIPGLAAGKYDMGASSFTDTKAREKVVDFVTYFSAGTSFYVAASGGATVMSLADLCGKKVGVERGTTQQTDATAQNAKCKATGKPAVQLSVFPDQNGANLALSSGRVEVVMADSPVAAYAVKQSNGHFALSGSPYGTAPYGIAIPKKSGLQKPILDALNKLIANGTYQKILAQWGVQQGAIANPAINAATS